ncbi:autotransporter assembly complex protein TamA [Pseudophaeobacter arcticus]|uniref:autotransporter assembly complex protein TamA n=1 Tax=Pseudophaeobacter arcticus TaxID=385492 RepID=UPI0024909EC1|nr:BamA/TamA family outer membrane protein [Pseudophaeobacter arcticus]
MFFNLPLRSAPQRALRAAALGLCVTTALLPTAGSSAEARLSAPGASDALTQRLQGASSVLGADPQVDAQELLAAALSDYRTLVQVLYDAGHFAPQVNIRLDGQEAARIEPLNAPRQINQVRITVIPGPSFRFSRAEITPWPTNSDVERPAGFATGQPATTGILRDASVAGLLAWRRAGHPKARLAQQAITANHRANTLDARLTMAPGAQLRFGALRLVTPSAVRAEAIQRIASLPTGEVYHPDLVAKSATRLRRTGAFSSVTLRAEEQPNPDGTLDYIATVEDMPPRRLTFGAELSSSDGIEVTATWMHRNLFGGAEKLRFETRLSGLGSSNDIDGRIALRLDQPASLGPDDNLFYLVEAERLDEEHYTATQARGGIGLRRVYSDQLFAEAGFGFNTILAEDAFGKRRFKYIAGFLRAEYDRRNSRVDATSGYFINARLTPFLGLDGTDDGLQVKLDGRIYHGLGGSDRLVLAGRAQLGSVIGPSLSNASPTLLFFSGGAGSVRGHEYQSLGVPVGANSAGGRGYLALSGELRGKITDKLSLVGFFDIGYVDSDAFVSSTSQSHSGAGFGLRYDVAGIGPLRVDFAYPVDGGTEDGLQFYIGIGQAF